MLSQNTIDIVKSTVPLLAEHGEAITRDFYTRLFDRNPELKHVFNQVNQTRGEQPRALASAVFAYAENIDNLEVLLPTVGRIAHKHVSLGIKPEQYPIVGENLLAAIQSVLGLPDGHAALTAWAEAYGVLADVFTGFEEEIYQANEKAEGGWRGFKEFRIDEIHTETEEVKSFYLVPCDGSVVPHFKGGQYVGVKVNPANSEFDEIRQYSLSGANKTGRLRITPKAEFEGLVSNHLHQCKVGESILLQAPTGVFNLAADTKQHVFVAGGVGITPLMSMLYEALEQGIKAEDILFIQCARAENFRVFQQELAALQAKWGFSYRCNLDEGDTGDHQGFLNTPILADWLAAANIHSEDAAVYFCGPHVFMQAANRCFLELKFATDAIHYEVFGPTSAL